jgi:hypothetical protein
MIPPVLKSALVAAVCVWVCVGSAHSAFAQETRGAASGASSWQAGTVKVTAPAATAAVTGGSSIWTAGKGSVPLGTQPGGVWRDGSTLSLTTSKPVPSGTATSTEPMGFPGLSPAPRPSARKTVSGGGLAPKTLGLQSSIAAHGLSGARPGGGARSQAGARKTSGSRGRAGAKRNTGFSHAQPKQEGTSHGLNSPLNSESELKPRTPGSSLETTPGTLTSPLEQPTH